MAPTKHASMLLLAFFASASQAADPSAKDNPAVAAMIQMQGTILSFVAFAIGGAAFGVALNRLTKTKSKAMREAVFSMSVMAGMGLGFFILLGH